MLKKYSIKKQFIVTFAYVMLASAIATGVTILVALSIINSQDFKEANYYEKMIPSIVKFIKENNTEILNQENRNELDSLIPSEGIRYRVISLNDNIAYGTLEELQVENKSELIEKINTSEVSSGNIIKRYVPIITDGFNLDGVVILQYVLKLTSSKVPRWVVSVVSMIALISPFIYISLFSYLFGIKLAKNINEPLDKLKWASEKIKNRDLDFKLEYPYENELGNVINSFDEMKKELKETLDKQWEMEEERKEIISGLSHDLRSPLTVIKGKVELLLEGTYKKEGRLISYLESINKSTDRAIILVEDLNIINKLESPTYVITKSNNNIVLFLNDKLDSIVEMVKEKHINIQLNTYGINQGTVWNFDLEAISRVLDNVLINAIRHINYGGEIDIDIDIEIKSNMLCFEITDTGEGFSEVDLKLALNKFYRGDKSRGTKSGNSGLGLYISKILIEKHKGEFVISNNNSGGANVKFYILK